jgi:hypothetical protein
MYFNIPDKKIRNSYKCKKMYSAEYLIFVAKQNLSSEYHDKLEMLAGIIPATGVLHNSIDEISKKIDCNNLKVKLLIEKLLKIKPKLMEIIGDNLVFNYETKEVDYVRHLRNAYSNLGILNL